MSVKEVVTVKNHRSRFRFHRQIAVVVWKLSPGPVTCACMHQLLHGAYCMTCCEKVSFLVFLVFVGVLGELRKFLAHESARTR